MNESPEQLKLRQLAEYCQNDNYNPGEAGYCSAKKADWHVDEHFPVASLQHLNTDWPAWFAEEVAMDENEDLHRGWRTLLHEDIREEVIILMRDGKGYIWDGWHRVGATIASGRETIPAIVGIPKPQPQSHTKPALDC